MEIIYDDRNSERTCDSFRLILLYSGWHVVARGYLCRVSDQNEGRRIIDGLKRNNSSTELTSQTNAC